MPRKRIAADLRSLARGHTEMCIKVLAGMVSQEAVPPAARVAAANILLERGWGKAAQSHTGEDGDGPVRVIIRHIVEGRDVPHEVAARPRAINNVVTLDQPRLIDVTKDDGEA